MLSLQKQNKYFSKEMLMPNGERAIVLFEVIEQKGKLIAKAISAQVISEKVECQSPICLPVTIAKQIYATSVSAFTNYISPFVKSIDVNLFQPTRAPSLA